MKAAVYLQPSKQGPIQRGHPWVFPKAILREVGQPETGKLIDVYGGDNSLVGIGVYNEHSLYRVRMLASANESLKTSSIESIVHHRIEQALLIRKSLNLPNHRTTAYRMVNSEGDGLSGLTIDRFNHVCVVSSTAYWVEANKRCIMNTIEKLLPQDDIIWLPHAKSLNQDGWKNSIDKRETRVEVVLEDGIAYHVDFTNAQKTGLFIDQRENHMRIAALAHGKRVLDLYSYTGGFALHAAKAGASKVTAVDSSPQAIIAAKNNSQLNQLDSVEWVEADARDYLSLAGDYDIVVLDPPKLVPSQRHLSQAKNYYRFLHREIFKVMKPGSLLMTCNCSAALTSNDFADLVYSQARAVGKSARVLGVYGPSSCHTTIPSFPEGNYLTAVLLGIV